MKAAQGVVATITDYSSKHDGACWRPTELDSVAEASSVNRNHACKLMTKSEIMHGKENEPTGYRGG